MNEELVKMSKEEVVANAHAEAAAIALSLLDDFSEMNTGVAIIVLGHLAAYTATRTEAGGGTPIDGLDLKDSTFAAIVHAANSSYHGYKARK